METVFVYVLDLLVVGGLLFLVATRGLERALPFLVFVLVLIPIDSVIQPSGFVDVTTHRIAIATVGAAFLVKRLGGHGPTRRHKDPLKYLMLLTVGWAVVSTVFSVVPDASWKATISLVVEYYFLYYVVAETISDKATIHRISLAIVLAMVVCCVLGVLEIYQSWSVMELFPVVEHRFGATTDPLVDIERGIRIRSTFPHPILFGGALCLVIPLVLHLLATKKTRAQAIFLWIAVLLMFLNIYHTGSRGPWIALVASLILLFIFHRGGMRKYVLVIGALTLLALVVRPGVYETIRERYLSTFDPNTPVGSSYAYRYALLEVSLEELGHSPARQVWGYGPQSAYFLGLRGQFQGREVVFLSIDSSWIELMLEIGFVGLFLTAALLLKGAVIGWRNYFALPSPDRYLCSVFFVNLAAFYFLMTNVAFYGWGQPGYMLWIVMAMMVALVRLRAPQAARTSQELGRSVPVPQLEAQRT